VSKVFLTIHVISDSFHSAPSAECREGARQRHHNRDSSEILSCCSLMIYRRRRETQFPVSSRWEREYNDVPFPLPNITSVLSICGPNLLNKNLLFLSLVNDWLTDRPITISLSLFQSPLFSHRSVGWASRDARDQLAFKGNQGTNHKGRHNTELLQSLSFSFSIYFYLFRWTMDGEWNKSWLVTLSITIRREDGQSTTTRNTHYFSPPSPL